MCYLIFLRFSFSPSCKQLLNININVCDVEEQPEYEYFNRFGVFVKYELKHIIVSMNTCPLQRKNHSHTCSNFDEILIH